MFTPRATVRLINRVNKVNIIIKRNPLHTRTYKKNNLIKQNHTTKNLVKELQKELSEIKNINKNLNDNIQSIKTDIKTDITPVMKSIDGFSTACIFMVGLLVYGTVYEYNLD